MPISTEQKELWLYELRLNGFILFRTFLPIDLVQTMYEEFQPLTNPALLWIPKE